MQTEGYLGYNGGIFQEIIHEKKIVWLWYFSDAEGNRVSPAVYGFPDEDREGNLDTILFEDLGNGRSRVIYQRCDPTATPEENEGAAAGYAQILDKLEALLASLQPAA
jgi:uncharacterized protein YndB with AHSA1/START domain